MVRLNAFVSQFMGWSSRLLLQKQYPQWLNALQPYCYHGARYEE